MLNKPLRLIELFAGYGSQALALKRLNIPFEHYRIVEFDKYAIKSYNAVHNTNFATSDIRDIHASDLAIEDTDKYNYLMTYSFPCTDLSNAGKGAGMSKGSNTRSGLLWEVERILTELNESEKLRLPQFLLMENVTQIHNEQNIKDFGLWVTFLDSLGYISKWQDLNAKDFGVPQNRDRCFMVSYLDKSIKYAFPSPIKLTKSAKDFLEDNVAEKYYIKTEKAKELIEKLVISNDLDSVIYIKDNTEQGYKELDSGGIVNLYYPESLTNRGHVQMRGRICPTVTVGRVVDLSTTESKIRDVSNVITTRQRGLTKHRQESTGVLEQVPKQIKITSRLAYLNKKRIDNVNQDIAKALTARDFKGFSSGDTSATQNGVIEYDYRIRKLTPLECFRLMDIEDKDALKMLAVNSESQCYKQAGNSIVVSVMVAIFNNLFCGGSKATPAQLDIFDIL